MLGSGDTAALRVVLGVTEVSAVVEMEQLRNNLGQQMKAYHLYESAKQYCATILRFANMVDQFPPPEFDEEEENPAVMHNTMHHDQQQQ